jgi:formylglycine-generating enzyme required for sulfatase activity
MGVRGWRACHRFLDASSDDPAARWIALYEREAELGADAFATPEPLGSFGLNALDVADIGGTVWEWTSTCASRSRLDESGRVLTHLPSCGVRYVEGRHRTQISTFVRDARAGGCSTGLPPDNLGFRLVRERDWFMRMIAPFVP